MLYWPERKTKLDVCGGQLFISIDRIDQFVVFGLFWGHFW